MHRMILTASAALVLVASGVVHGVWTDRWTANPEVVKAAADRFAQVPMAFGQWEGADLKMATDPKLGLAAVLVRRYANRATGKVISIYLACGRPGPVCVHSPDVCYPADGYLEVESARRITLSGEVATLNGTTPNEFWTGRYMRQRQDGQTNLRIFWAWHTSSGWKVADTPRVAFAGEQVLHKLYVIRELANPNEPAEADACAVFMREFLPLLEEKLFR